MAQMTLYHTIPRVLLLNLTVGYDNHPTLENRQMVFTKLTDVN